MKLKVKKLSCSKVPETPLEVVNARQFEESDEFLFNCRNYQYSVPQLRTFLSQEFRRVFPNLPYPENKSMKLVQLAIGYELLVRCYKKSHLPIPPKVERNHKAAIAFKPEQLEPSMRTLYEIQKNQGDYDMKTAKAVPIKKSPKAEATVSSTMKAKKQVKEAEGERQTLAGLYISLFEQIANGKKITDKEISAKVKAQFGKNHPEARVERYRSLYNTGNLAGQKSAPKLRSEKVEK